MVLLFKWIALTLSILIVSYLLDGIHVDSFGSAFLAAAALGVLNTVVRPVLLLLTLPINLLTLGILTFIINALLLLFVSAIIPGFDVDGFWVAVIGAVLISVIHAILTWCLPDKSSFFFVRKQRPPHGDNTIDLKQNERGRWE